MKISTTFHHVPPKFRRLLTMSNITEEMLFCDFPGCHAGLYTSKRHQKTLVPFATHVGIVWRFSWRLGPAWGLETFRSVPPLPLPSLRPFALPSSIRRWCRPLTTLPLLTGRPRTRWRTETILGSFWCGWMGSPNAVFISS